jgi:erythromycin esterase-like protein
MQAGRIMTQPSRLAGDAAIIGSAAQIVNVPANWDRLVARAASSQFVLIGEASHGTHEFYDIRAQLSKRLIEEHGFRILALEADWPDMLRVHRYITGRGEDSGAQQALSGFKRFPAWMWRNTVMLEFADWLRDWNLRQAEDQRAGIFGMDLYSMHTSMEAVLTYLEKVNPEAATRARARYACFEMFGDDPQAYGYATTRGRAESCQEEVVAQLAELHRRYGELIGHDGRLAGDEFFYAEQNARLVANAESYYRSMFRDRDESWNLRDAHMTDTLAALVRHFDSGRSKVIVWAHNSHLGDARATDMGRRGEWNVGQLIRERLSGRVFGIGFTTHTGTVTAARDWGGPAESRRVRSSLPGSYELLFHETGIPRFWLDLHTPGPALTVLRQQRLERAIGVIYRPETERWSHYFRSALPSQFDAVIHIDTTRALEPLERNSEWDRGELPETFPEGV